MLDAHGYRKQESTVKALLLVKDELQRIGGVMKLNITADIILEVEKPYGKYIADLEKKKTMEDAIKQGRDKQIMIKKTHRCKHKALGKQH